MTMTRTVAMTRTTQETRNHDDIPIPTFILVFISISPRVEASRHALCIYTQMAIFVSLKD